METNMSLNSRPMLTLEKEIVSKADTRTIENISARNNKGAGIDSSIPTTPTTLTGLMATLGA